MRAVLLSALLLAGAAMINNADASDACMSCSEKCMKCVKRG